MEQKSFETHKVNGFVVNFKNGNSASVIWGRGSYTENYDAPYGDAKGNERYLQSDTVEIQVNCSEKLFGKILRKLFRNSGDGHILEYVSLPELMVILNILNKETRKC